MSKLVVPISEAARQTLRDLADQLGRTEIEVLDKALDAYRRQVFIEKVNSAYAALRADTKAWAEVEEERRSMAGSLMDGLDPDERWGEDGDLLPPQERQANG